MNDYLSKPFHMDALVEMLFKWLKPRRSHENETVEQVEERHAKQTPSTTVEEDVTIENLYGINYQEGMANCGDDIGLYQMILTEFKNTHKNDPEYIVELIKKQDWEETIFQAHRLKGVAASVGATKLSEILKEVETQVKNKHYDQLHPLTEKLLKESKLIWEDLEQL